MAKDEPQSYGSQADWVSGHVGQEVNHPKAPAGENRRESESSAPHQGGDTPAEQLAGQNDSAPSCDEMDGGDEGAKKVTDVEGGARRDGFFKQRDYSS